MTYTQVFCRKNRTDYMMVGVVPADFDAVVARNPKERGIPQYYRADGTPTPAVWPNPEAGCEIHWVSETLRSAL